MSRYRPGKGFAEMPWWGFLFLAPFLLLAAIPSFGISLLVLAYAIWVKAEKTLRNPIRSVNRHAGQLTMPLQLTELFWKSVEKALLKLRISVGSAGLSVLGPSGQHPRPSFDSAP